MYKSLTIHNVLFVNEIKVNIKTHSLSEVKNQINSIEEIIKKRLDTLETSQGKIEDIKKSPNKYCGPLNNMNDIYTIEENPFYKYKYADIFNDEDLEPLSYEYADILNDLYTIYVNLCETAIENNRLDVLQYLIDEKEITLNQQDNLGIKLLYAAVNEGQLEIIKYLINSQKVNAIQRINEQNTTILELAAQKGHLNVVKYLIEVVKLDPAQKSEQNNTVLFLAVWGLFSDPHNRNNNLQVVNYLIHHTNVDINARCGLQQLTAGQLLDYVGYTMEAAYIQRGNIEINQRQLNSFNAIENNEEKTKVWKEAFCNFFNHERKILALQAEHDARYKPVI